MTALFLVFLSLNISANVGTKAQLKFDASAFKFIYLPSTAPPLLVIENKKQHDIKALTENFWKLPTAKSYFDLSYGYIKNHGRKYKESIKVDITDTQVNIFSSAPLRKITIANYSMPLHLLVSEKHTLNQKAATKPKGFQFILTKKLLNNFCHVEKACQFSVTDVRGKEHFYDYPYAIKPTLLPIKAVGFYGFPCRPSCVDFNSQSLKTLSEHLCIKVIDVANQQRTFNETILCESGVLKNCQNGLVTNNTKETLEWHVMENQLVAQQQEIIQYKRFFQSEVLIAWVNPMRNETYYVTSVFAKHKHKKALVELLAKKTAVIAQVIISQPPQEYNQ
jgi:hypothetical protein